MDPVIIAHGGIEFLHSGSSTSRKQVALNNAVVQGYAAICNGKPSVEAVEMTISILEDDQHFNAGYGSVFNADGEVELDAGMMNGTTLKVGSVGAIKDVDHPITLAKYVMELTEHSLLVGKGARKFAAGLKVPKLFRGSLVNFHLQSRDRWDTGNPESCTVGVVAIDAEGRCTAGSSSGGGSGKMAGRVGSSAIAGAGFYADSSIGGCVATGHGESIMQSCLCFNLVDQMSLQAKSGQLAMLAVKNAVEAATRRFKKSVGIVALDCDGEFGVAFSAPRMPWAYCRRGKLRFGAESGENYVKDAIEGSNISVDVI
ncbi:isoaspartyl peptidase/L-asparaginase [Neodiprion pinetum]|uniref:isoaspartyl peptidase/L-asparaginase n=1 Tax=Neodiprion pinetum TaxID=441929 RepID=UPI001EDCE103|nr:isoaspartyl peptidase/L-asparaginase-like [Neodiprion pinetum]